MNIILIGMPGAGKSTVGVVLAKTLGMSFTDTDLLIQRKEKMLLQEILDQKGVEGFLRAEEESVLSASCTDTVIATGGSVVYSAAAMDHLRALGKVVYLKLDYPEIEKRLNNIRTRGVILPKGQGLLDVYRQRLPLYEKYADRTVDCEGMSVEQIVGLIQAMVL